MQQPETEKAKLGYGKSLSVGISALFLLVMLLNACVYSPTPPGTLPPVGPIVGQTIAVGGGVGFFKSGTPSVLETYSIQAITTTRMLTDSNVVTALSRAYTGTVQLEFALLHEGVANKWKLIYNAKSLPIQNPTIWYDYSISKVFPQDPPQENTASIRVSRWQPYNISIPIPLTSTVASDSPPVDLAGWIDAICPTDDTNTCKQSIARLIFSVKAGGKTQRVAYLSDLKETGEYPTDQPDGPNSCQTNREGKWYCVIVDLLTGS